MNKLSEKILLYKLQTKAEPELFGKLYDEYAKRIYRFVYFKISNREEAEDLTSEVFLKAWRYLQEKKEIKSFSGLLYRIARNEVIDLYRKRMSKPEVSLEDIEKEENKKIYETLDDKMAAEGVVKGIKKLKQEYQEVVTLRYVDELEIDEIAEIIGKGKITVRVTLHRALKKLKEIMGEGVSPSP